MLFSFFLPRFYYNSVTEFHRLIYNVFHLYFQKPERTISLHCHVVKAFFLCHMAGRQNKHHHQNKFILLQYHEFHPWMQSPQGLMISYRSYRLIPLQWQLNFNIHFGGMNSHHSIINIIFFCSYLYLYLFTFLSLSLQLSLNTCW